MYIHSKAAYEIIQKTILDGVKTPHRVSHPVLRKTETGYALAVFLFFFTKDNIQNGQVGRPSLWALADIETGGIISRHECKENDYSFAQFDEVYNIRADGKYDTSPQYYAKAFELLDSVRTGIIESGAFDKVSYEEYLKMILNNIPKDYQRFFLELSKTEGDERVSETEILNSVEENATPVTEPEKVVEQESESAVEDSESLVAKLSELSQAVANLQKSFDEKIMEDAHKNEMFDSMHRELTNYQNGLMDKIVNTMAMDIIQLVDSTKKLFKAYEKKEPTEENYKKLLKSVKGIAEDLQDILYRQSIESYSVQGKEVDVRRQKIIQTIDTDDKAKDNLLAVRTAEGYEKDGKVLRPERIKIYKYNPDAKKEDNQ